MRDEQTPFASPQRHSAGDDERRLRDLAARVLRTIGVARALVQNGRTLNLSGMDDGIGLLCAQTLDLPSAAGAAMLPQLRVVLAGVDSLMVALQAADPIGFKKGGDKMGGGKTGGDKAGGDKAGGNAGRLTS